MSVVVKSPSRRAAATASVVVATKPAKAKTSVYLPDASLKRLGACCLQEGLTQSDVVQWLIDTHLSGYYVSVKGKRIGSADRAEPDDSGTTDDRRESAADVTSDGAAAP